MTASSSPHDINNQSSSSHPVNEYIDHRLELLETYPKGKFWENRLQSNKNCFFAFCKETAEMICQLHIHRDFYKDATRKETNALFSIIINKGFESLKSNPVDEICLSGIIFCIDEFFNENKIWPYYRTSKKRYDPLFRSSQKEPKLMTQFHQLLITALFYPHKTVAVSNQALQYIERSIAKNIAGTLDIIASIPDFQAPDDSTPLNAVCLIDHVCYTFAGEKVKVEPNTLVKLFDFILDNTKLKTSPRLDGILCLIEKQPSENQDHIYQEIQTRGGSLKKFDLTSYTQLPHLRLQQ